MMVKNIDKSDMSLIKVLKYEDFRFCANHYKNWLDNYEINEGFEMLMAHLEGMDEEKRYYICRHISSLLLNARLQRHIHGGYKFFNFDKCDSIRDMLEDYIHEIRDVNSIDRMLYKTNRFYKSFKKHETIENKKRLNIINRIYNFFKIF